MGAKDKKFKPPKRLEGKYWWYFLFAFVLALFFFQLARFTPRETISYSEFRTLLREGLVDDLVIGEDFIEGKLKPGASEVLSRLRGEQVKLVSNRFYTTRLEDPDLIKILDEKGVQYEAAKEASWLKELLSWVLPLLFFLGLWVLLMRRFGPPEGGLMGVAKSKARIYVQDEIDVTFKDVAGVDEAVEELKQIIEFL
ncbi:MAG: cell division protein FtsH, partial [Thermodesulfobacteria bacterium]|nr:cell division protein FtsH [Thermodesulfobacteriota bacterium]